MNGSRIAIFCAALALTCSTLHAQSIDSLFTMAREAYRSEDFAASAEAYESIISNGRTSASIAYNLGNAYFRMGRTAKAILMYERALRLDPTDGDIQHNLELARLRTVDRIEPLPELFIRTWIGWLNASLPVSITASVFMTGWCLIFVSLTIMFLVRSAVTVRMMRKTFFAGGVIGLLGGIVLVLQVFATPETQEGIIMAPTVTATTSPDQQSVEAFVVHEGLKITLGDSVEGWVRITLADGKTGWIREEEVEKI